MKKIFVSILIAAFMCFALVGCGGAKTGGGTPSDNNGGGDGPDGYTVTFACDEHVNVFVYDTQDMSGNGTDTDVAYSRDGSTGEKLKDGNGQVNFKLVFDGGYELADIAITDGYNNLKGPSDTGTANGYRITKISADLTVTVTSKAENAAEDLNNGYKVTFDCDEHVSVLVYKTQDISGDGEVSDTAYSRDSGTGALLKDGNGQVNFKLVFDEGYELKKIDIEGDYNNLKGSADTDDENGYRITKIASELTVTVTSQAEGVTEDFTQGYKATFVCDEHVSVLVYKTQDMDGDGEATDTAYSRESGTGILTKDDGQVNFVIVIDEGYELDEIVITADEGKGYKNLKGPVDTEVDNGYRITKISAELTITITTKAAA